MKKRVIRFVNILILIKLLIIPYAEIKAGKECIFEDIKEDWYYGAVIYTYENKLMMGVSDTRFEPFSSMSRAMFVTVLGRLCGAELKETENFDDIKRDSWYSGYVGWASELGIIEGFPDGSFCPEKPVNREQMAAIIVRYIEFVDVKICVVSGRDEDFSDADKISDWAREYVNKLRLWGIAEGDQNDHFNPQDTMTRAEAAAVIMRLHKMIDFSPDDGEEIIGWR